MNTRILVPVLFLALLMIAYVFSMNQLINKRGKKGHVTIHDNHDDGADFDGWFAVCAADGSALSHATLHQFSSVMVPAHLPMALMATCVETASLSKCPVRCAALARRATIVAICVCLQ